MESAQGMEKGKKSFFGTWPNKNPSPGRMANTPRSGKDAPWADFAVISAQL